jgi:hypothetical protein
MAEYEYAIAFTLLSVFIIFLIIFGVYEWGKGYDNDSVNEDEDGLESTDQKETEIENVSVLEDIAELTDVELDDGDVAEDAEDESDDEDEDEGEDEDDNEGDDEGDDEDAPVQSVLSPEDLSLLAAYHAHPEMHEAVNRLLCLDETAPAAQNKKSALNKRFWIAFIILTVAVGALNGILKSQGYTLSGLGTFFMHLCAFLLAYIIGGKQK